MTTDDILRMAREAGIDDATARCIGVFLERFARLVAAHEREQCAGLVQSFEGVHRYVDDIAEAILARGSE